MNQNIFRIDTTDANPSSKTKKATWKLNNQQQNLPDSTLQVCILKLIPVKRIFL